ncbi:MAG: TetR/AcrR family transcriptional regulator [Chloroflexota bacterium]
MDKTDRRVKRTNRLLQDALVSLTLERGFDEVTIRDITERADVGYATFFRHYPDKETLLADVLQVMKDDLTQLLAPYSIVSAPEKTGVLIFEYVQENCDLCRVLLDSTDTMNLLQPVQQIGLQEAAPLLSPAQVDGVPVELATSHLMSSLVMLIRWWLDRGMPYPPERMGRFAAELIIKPVLAAFSV